MVKYEWIDKQEVTKNDIEKFICIKVRYYNDEGTINITGICEVSGDASDEEIETAIANRYAEIQPVEPRQYKTEGVIGG
ncbi:hypothetical protein [Rossellomorea vietnamensis]|uniref:hypothetical protein n=1 Tax=Rossellomorea vietnamensis TaxID=218284 RepID=UPI000557DFB4|nr:hypothetical protein [Rossellomorea vietnamensis]